MLYNYTRGRFLENRRESDKVRKAFYDYTILSCFKGRIYHFVFIWKLP